MAMVKTDYGLVYNDDGSLCVTKRTDDVPFPGTTAWAVEEGTTNYFTANGGVNLTSISAYNATVAPTYSQLTNEEWFGTIPLHVNMGEGGARYFSQGNMPTDTTNGTTYTFSIYVRPKVTRILRLHTDEGFGPHVECEAGIWTRLTLTFTTTATYRWLDITGWQPYDVIDFAAPLLEKKPFATSFVDGTRPDGRFRTFDDAFCRSIITKGIVISGWYKRNKTLESSEGFRLFSCTQSGGFNVEKLSDGRFHISINDNGVYKHGSITDPNIFDDLDWHYVVFFYDPDTKTAKLYIDATEQASVVLTKGLYFNPAITYELAIGHEYPTGAELNGLISDPFIGRPYDKNGNFVWTNSYIKQVYEARAPFNVPPKIPVT